MELNSVASIFGEYGNYQWNKGFMIGHITGLCLGGAIAWTLLSKQR